MPIIKNGSNLGTASGIAPGAFLAMYKVFWTTPSLDGQATDADLIAAVNQAIIDGVDVLSCSWGSPASDKSLHSFDYIFMNAAQVREEVISDAEGCEKRMKSLAIVRKLYTTDIRTENLHNEFAARVTHIVWMQRLAGDGEVQHL